MESLWWLIDGEFGLEVNNDRVSELLCIGGTFEFRRQTGPEVNSLGKHWANRVK